jgi:hypothetical protein
MKIFEFVVEELKNYVRKEEFIPVKTLVFGVTGIILVAVIGALVTVVLK